MGNTNHSPTLAVFVSIIISIIFNGPCGAWSNEPAINTPICEAADHQFNQMITSDGNGGAIITWQDYRDRYGTMSDIYAQKVDSHGKVQWTSDGVAVSTAPSDQVLPQIVSDGAGGAIITWEDNRNGTTDIYAQRIDASGSILWQADGVAICAAAYTQAYPQIVSDGQGGAIITWQDSRGNQNGPSNVYAQRISPTGTIHWVSDGVLVSGSNSGQHPQIVSDGNAGAIVTWFSGVSDGIHVQRIGADGIVLWATGGVVLSAAAAAPQALRMASDGKGGAIVTWQDDRNGYNASDIYTQGIDGSGNIKWPSDVAITTRLERQLDPQIIPDGQTGAVITWHDFQDGRIYAQRIGGDGKKQWKKGGVQVTPSAPAYQLENPQIAGDGKGGAIITWDEYRDTHHHINAQRLNAIGDIQWAADGVAIATAPGDQGGAQMVRDGTGGAIIAFWDTRGDTANYDIYAQRISSRGQLQPVELLSPDGGEVIASGSTYQNIEWGAPLEADHFKLLYSIDNGLSWKTIDRDITGTAYPWPVSAQNGNKTQCKVKVIGYDASDIKIGSDVSDEPFAIEVMKVTYPNGSEEQHVGAQDYIRWRFGGTLRPVAKMLLFGTTDGGISWQKIRTLDSGPYAPGSYEEQVPVAPGLTKTKHKCRIKVVLKDNSNITLGTDMSDDFFTILFP
jgi:hypothetical protein